MPVGRLEFRQQVLPSRCLRWHRIRRVDVAQRAGNGNGAGHCGGGKMPVSKKHFRATVAVKRERSLGGKKIGAIWERDLTLVGR